MDTITKRNKKYIAISNALDDMSDRQLEQLISEGQSMHTGIGGASFQVKKDGILAFVKKIPVTDLELLPENYMSTANIFNLPIGYQYGIGSAGFSVWRELSAHMLTTHWVLTNQCPNFPIMYHWRILKDISRGAISQEQQEALHRDTDYWEGNLAIRCRLEEQARAEHYLYLFLEFIPSHLYDWLNDQLASSEDTAIRSLYFVEKEMKETHAFMMSQNFLHMDAHFENILTDGERLYYSDFGLSVSSSFSLDKREVDFMRDNAFYDYASGASNLVHAVLTSYLGRDNWEVAISECAYSQCAKGIPIKADLLLSRYYKLALRMHNFYRAIQKDKSIIFPSDEVKVLISVLLD